MWSYRDLLSDNPKPEEKIILYPSDEIEDLSPEFEDFLNIYWTIYKVAPSIQIDYREAYLKKCAKYLREKLTFINETVDEGIKVTLTELKGLILTEYDKSSIKVVVEYGKIVKYSGIFLSCGTAKPHDGVYLPLLLAHGEKRLASIIHKILAELFNCQITQFDVFHDYMWWMFSVIVQTECDNSEQQIELVFMLPQINKNNEDGSVSCFITHKHATVTWRKHCNKKNKIVKKNMSDFSNEICKHVEDLFGILISKLIFQRIRTNTIFTNGYKFKTTSVSVLCNVIIFLCQNFCLSNHNHD